jgi:hypothetical protein
MTLDFMRGDLQERMTQGQAMFIQNQWGRWFESNLQYISNRTETTDDAVDF